MIKVKMISFSIQELVGVSQLGGGGGGRRVKGGQMQSMSVSPPIHSL